MKTELEMLYDMYDNRKTDPKKHLEEHLLIEKAIAAAKLAYAPYSKYHVGAALLSKSGEIYTGCNIENASFGATNCAERTAFFKAVSEGATQFRAIAIIGGPVEGEDMKKSSFSDYAYPCGICRQVMQEFCQADFEILVARSVEDYKKYTLQELLPHGFGGKQ